MLIITDLTINSNADITIFSIYCSFLMQCYIIFKLCYYLEKMLKNFILVKDMTWDIFIFL